MTLLLIVTPPTGLIWPGSKMTAVAMSDATVGLDITWLKGKFNSYADAAAAYLKDPKIKVAFDSSGLHRDPTYGTYAPVWQNQTSNFTPTDSGDYFVYAEDIITDILGVKLDVWFCHTGAYVP